MSNIRFAKYRLNEIDIWPIVKTLLRFVLFIIIAYCASEFIIFKQNFKATELPLYNSGLFRLAFFFKVLAFILLFLAPAIEYGLWSFDRKMGKIYQWLFTIVFVFCFISWGFLLLSCYEVGIFELLNRNWFLSTVSIVYLSFLWYLDYAMMKSYENEGEVEEVVFYEKLVKYADRSVFISVTISIIIYFIFVKGSFGSFFDLDYKNDPMVQSTEIFFDGALVFQIIVSTVIFYVIFYEKIKQPKQ